MPRDRSATAGSAARVELVEAARPVGARDARSEREGSQERGIGGPVCEERSSQLKRSDGRAERVSVDHRTRRFRPTGRHLPGDLLDAVFGGRREPTTSYEAYVRYRDQGGRARDLDLAFARALPVIREVCGSRDRSHIGAAAWAIWRALREKRFTGGGRTAYWAYLRLTARGAMAHQRAADHRFRLVDRVAPEVCTDGMRVTGRLPGLREIEQKMVVEKIPVVWMGVTSTSAGSSTRSTSDARSELLLG